MKKAFSLFLVSLVLVGGLNQVLAAKQNPASPSAARYRNTFQTPTNLFGTSWTKYTSENNYFVDIEYPSNLYVGEFSENGFPFLQIQSTPGTMSLPGETSCAEVFEDCNVVTRGLRIMIKAIDFGTHTTEEAKDQLVGFDNNNLEPTPYHNVRKVKNLSAIKPILDPANLKSTYFYTGALNAVYQIDVYEKDFQGDLKGILDHLFSSLESNKRFGRIQTLKEQAGVYSLNVDLAQFFPFWEASQAAKEDNKCIEIVNGVCKVAPPGTYIRDLTHELTSFPLSPNVKILTTTYDQANAGAVKKISLEQFKKIFNGTDQLHASLKNSFYFFELKDGKIVTILEMFKP